MTARPQLNEAGDLVVTDAAELAGELGTTMSPADVADRLRRMATVGLVVADGNLWSAAGRGIYFEIPRSGDGSDAAAAARGLSNVMLAKYDDVPRRWLSETEPALDNEWASAAGLLNAGFTATADELREIQEELERVLLPYTGRAAADAPRRRPPRPRPQLLPALGRAVLTTCQFGGPVDQRLGVADGGLRLRLGEPHRGLLSGAVLRTTGGSHRLLRRRAISLRSRWKSVPASVIVSRLHSSTTGSFAEMWITRSSRLMSYS